eukprot:241625-Amphidinium_carterae.1
MQGQASQDGEHVASTIACNTRPASMHSNRYMTIPVGMLFTCDKIRQNATVAVVPCWRQSEQPADTAIRYSK